MTEGVPWGRRINRAHRGSEGVGKFEERAGALVGRLG